MEQADAIARLDEQRRQRLRSHHAGLPPLGPRGVGPTSKQTGTENPDGQTLRRLRRFTSASTNPSAGDARRTVLARSITPEVSADVKVYPITEWGKGATFTVLQPNFDRAKPFVVLSALMRTVRSAGDLLREWRRRRQMTQLDLALSAIKLELRHN